MYMYLRAGQGLGESGVAGPVDRLSFLRQPPKLCPAERRVDAQLLAQQRAACGR